MSLIAPLGRLLCSRRADPMLGVAGIPELQTGAVFTVSSASFEDGGEMPLRHAAGRRGDNLSPELSWSGLPEGTEQLLLVLEDVDVPMRRPAPHTIALLTPEPATLGEGELVASDRVRFVPAMLGSKGYQGPRPLPGHGPHRYGFHLWSLDRAVPADARPKRLAELLRLIAGHVTAHGVIVGVQEGCPARARPYARSECRSASRSTTSSATSSSLAPNSPRTRSAVSSVPHPPSVAT